MSQPTQPMAPKQNLMQTFLLAVTMFLAFQLFFNKETKTDTKTAKEVLQTMQKESLTQKDVTLAQELNTYKSKINSDSGLKEKEKIEKILEATMLVASTQLQSGIARHDIDRLNNAYNTLSGEERVHNDEPAWRDKTYLALNDKGNLLVHTSPTKLYNEISEKLQTYNKNLKIWGFFPGYDFMDALVHLTGAYSWSYGLAALLLAIIVRTIVWPLALKTTLHSRKMSQLVPLINELKEKYKGPELNMKTMELYKQYGMNPVSGCLPAAAQIPLFLVIFQAMSAYKFEFKKGTFLWINPQLSESTNGFLAHSLGEMDYILITLYGASMLLTTFLNPPTDPVNAQQQKTTSIMVSIMFSVMMFFWPLPSAFVLYWIFANLLGVLQTLYINRIPVAPLMRINASGEATPLSNLMNGSLFNKIGGPKPKKQRPKK